jgi:hypothetical protein
MLLCKDMKSEKSGILRAINFGRKVNFLRVDLFFNIRRGLNKGFGSETI